MNSFDAAIVGGGIIGGSIAFELARQKLRVVVLDRQQPGREASWAAAGMLAPAPEYADSPELVSLARASLALYSEFARAVEEFSGRAVDFEQKGSIFAFFGDEAEQRRDAALAMHRELGLTSEPATPVEARALEPTLSAEARAALWLPDEARVDNRALTEAALAAARALGAEVHSGARVTSLLVQDKRCTGVQVGQDRISAATVIVAAGCYSAELEAVARYAPTRPVRGQMVALRSAAVRVERVLRSSNGYVLPRRDGRLICGSTLEIAGFEKRVTPSGIQQILAGAVELVPALAQAEIVETWSGLRPDTPDHLPVLGPTDLDGLLIATGHYRNGILLAPVTAKLMREWVVDGRASRDTTAFSPMRF